MSDWLNGMKVPPLKITQIRELAGTIRNSLGVSQAEPFPVMFFLETAMVEALEGFDWEVDESLPRDVMACAFPDGCRENPNGPHIKIRPEVYEAAHAGDGRARLTVLHECGHVLLHRKVSALNRESAPRGVDLRPFENSEWQANVFAAEVLMPPGSFTRRRGLSCYCSRMGVSRGAALTQGKKLFSRNEIPAQEWLNDPSE